MQLGIVSTEYVTNDGSFFGTQTNYIRFMYQFGKPELITIYTPLEKMLELDGIFLPGGSDVDSKRYGEEPDPWAGKPSQQLEFFDTQLLPDIIGKVPLIGICRGLQTINVLLGGTLDQHLKDHYYYSDKDDDLVHEVSTGDGTKFKVNSFHHQGIKILASGLKAVAKTKNNLIEAIYSKELKIFGVQWHPERMLYDNWSEDYIWKVLKGE